MPLAEVTKGFHSLGGEMLHASAGDKLSAHTILVRHWSEAEACAICFIAVPDVWVATDVHEGDVLVLERGL
jgi:hypothetical protein